MVEFHFSGLDAQVANDGLQDQSFFSNGNFFQIEEGLPRISIDFDELVINQANQTSLFLRPQGEAYTDSQEVIYYEARRGHLHEGENRLNLMDEVNLKFENSELDADKVVYSINKDLIEASGSVKTQNYNPETLDQIQIWASRLISWPRLKRSEYSGQVRGKIERRRVYEEAVEFRSEILELDLNQQLVTLNQDVVMEKQQLNARAHRGEIYLENYNKRLKYFALYDDVKLEEQVMLRGESYTRLAFAEKLEGIMSEERLILTGYPKVYQRDDVIKGNRIVLRENNEVIEVEDAQSQFIIR